MPNTSNFEGVTSKNLPIIYVVDTSGSMEGQPIASLNDAMRDTIKELKKKQDDLPVKIKIGVLQFNSEASWVTVNSSNSPVLQDLEDFEWRDLSAVGMTCLGDALSQLNACMSKSALFANPEGNKMPIVIFMSDGGPNDEWQKSLSEIQTNKWFAKAIKIAFAIGDGADTDTLAQVVATSSDGKTFAPNYEAVIKTDNLKTFSNLIKAVSVTSTLIHGKSRPDSKPENTTAEIVHNVTVVPGHDIDPYPNPDPNPDPDPDPDPYLDNGYI